MSNSSDWNSCGMTLRSETLNVKYIAEWILIPISMNDLQHICFSYILSLVLTEAIVIKGSRRALNICIGVNWGSKC